MFCCKMQCLFDRHSKSQWLPRIPSWASHPLAFLGVQGSPCKVRSKRLMFESNFIMVYHAPQLDDDTPFCVLSATQCTEMTGQVKKLSEKIKKQTNIICGFFPHPTTPGGGNQLGSRFRKNTIFLVVTNPKGAFIQACLGVALGTDLGNGGEVVAWPEM